MQTLSNLLSSLPSDVDPESIYKQVLPELIQLDIFSPLYKNNYLEFHQKIMSISGLPHGVGLGLACMAQLNVAGKCLYYSSLEGDSNAASLLDDVIQGKKIISMGVSEKNWKGRISNIKSCIETQDSKLILNANKSFFTNGYHSDAYLIVVKSVDHNKFKVVSLNKNTPGLNVEKFTLPFATVATHCRINCENILLDESNILKINYKDYSDRFRIFELLSMGAVFCGFIPNIIHQILTNDEFKNLNSLNEINKSKIFNFHLEVEMLRSKILEISTDLEKDPDNLEFYPYGLELVIEKLNSLINDLGIADKIKQKIPDLGLFFMNDPLNEYYKNKKMKEYFVTHH